MSIENGVFNLLHSSGVLCVKQVATCVKIIVCNNGTDGGYQKNGTYKIILFNALRIIKKGEKHGKKIVNWKLGLRIWPL